MEHIQNYKNDNELTYSLIGSSDELDQREHNLRKQNVDSNHIDMEHHDELFRLVKDLGPEYDAFNNFFKKSWDDWDTPTARQYKKMIKDGHPFTYYDYIKKDKRNGKKGINKSRSLITEIILTLNTMETRPENVKFFLDNLQEFSEAFEKEYKNIHIILSTAHADEMVTLQKPNVKALKNIESVFTDSLIQKDKNIKIYGAPHIHIDFIFFAHAITDKNGRKEIREKKAKMKKEAMIKYGENFSEKIFDDSFTQHLVNEYNCSLITGPALQMSITKALYEMGFNLDNNIEQLQPFHQFINDVRQRFVPQFLESKGYKVDRRLNPNRPHFFKDEYIRSKINEKTLDNLIQNQQLFIQAKKFLEKMENEINEQSIALNESQKIIDKRFTLLEEKEKKLSYYDKVFDFAKEAKDQLTDKTNSKFMDIKNYPKERLGMYVGNFCRYFALKDTIYNRIQKDLEGFSGFDFMNMGKSMLDNKCNNIFVYLKKKMNNSIYIPQNTQTLFLDKIGIFLQFYKNTKYIQEQTSLDTTKEETTSYNRGGGMGM